MLKNIKNLIMQKQEFLESASAIFEDGSGMNLDDVIVLSEDAEVPEEEQEESEGDFSEDEIEAPEDDTNNIDNESSIEDSELNNIPDDNNEEPSLEDEPLNDNIEIPNDSNNEVDNGNINDTGIDDESINSEEPLPLPGNNLPDPVGKQTGLPITGDIDDLLNMSLDIKSNTFNDILPTPPNNAGDAIADNDDIINQRIDSGFGESLDNDFGDELLSEAITLEGDDNNQNNNNDQNNNQNNDQNQNNNNDSQNDNEDSGEENEVTKQVRDKVAEADGETPEDNNQDNNEEQIPDEDATNFDDMEGLDDFGEDPMVGDEPDGGSGDNNNVDILKDIGDLTKKLEDVKQKLLDSM